MSDGCTRPMSLLPSESTSSARAGAWSRSGGDVRKYIPPLRAGPSFVSWAAVFEPEHTSAVSRTVSRIESADVDAAGPMIASASSSSTRLRVASTTVRLSMPSSAVTRRTARPPATPPAALISSTAILTGSRSDSMTVAYSPVSGARLAMTSSFFAEPCAAVGRGRRNEQGDADEPAQRGGRAEAECWPEAGSTQRRRRGDDGPGGAQASQGTRRSFRFRVSPACSRRV